MSGGALALPAQIVAAAKPRRLVHEGKAARRHTHTPQGAHELVGQSIRSAAVWPPRAYFSQGQQRWLQPLAIRFRELTKLGRQSASQGSARPPLCAARACRSATGSRCPWRACFTCSSWSDVLSYNLHANSSHPQSLSHLRRMGTPWCPQGKATTQQLLRGDGRLCVLQLCCVRAP